MYVRQLDNHSFVILYICVYAMTVFEDNPLAKQLALGMIVVILLLLIGCIVFICYRNRCVRHDAKQAVARLNPDINNYLYQDNIRTMFKNCQV